MTRSTIWTREEEAANLSRLLKDIGNRRRFFESRGAKLNESAISQHINGSRPISMKYGQAYARALGLPLAAISPRLAQEVGALERDEHGRIVVAGSPISNVEAGPEIRGRVPLISWVQAGDFIEAADPFAPGDAEAWLDCPVSHSPRAYALRVRGDSMTAPTGNVRTYPEGCIIFVDPELRSPRNGQRIIAALEGDGDGSTSDHQVTFKVYKNEDGRQWLQPLNPSHEPIRKPFRVLGTVIGKWEDE